MSAGIPMLAVIATVANVVQGDTCSKLEMKGYKVIYASTDATNTYYEVVSLTDIEHNCAPLLKELHTANNYILLTPNISSKFVSPVQIVITLLVHLE